MSVSTLELHPRLALTHELLQLREFDEIDHDEDEDELEDIDLDDIDLDDDDGHGEDDDA